MKVLYEYNYRGTRIKCVVGDITSIEADAIVNPANSWMLMGGGVAGVLKRKGGSEIEREARKYAPVEIGKAIVTSAGRLRAKYVIHSPTMEKPAMKISSENAYKATKAALFKGIDLNVSKIAFPGMGTGIGGLSPKEAAKAMLRAIREVLDSVSECFDEIIIIDINKEVPEAFCKELEKYR
ncbi:MAG: macro domain-containing protein [Staphylothermus sp.]|nr:macro domain-containing protein [Staphylothermus sp.]